MIASRPPILPHGTSWRCRRTMIDMPPLGLGLISCPTSTEPPRPPYPGSGEDCSDCILIRLSIVPDFKLWFPPPYRVPSLLLSLSRRRAPSLLLTSTPCPAISLPLYRLICPPSLSSHIRLTSKSQSGQYEPLRPSLNQSLPAHALRRLPPFHKLPL